MITGIYADFAGRGDDAQLWIICIFYKQFRTVAAAEFSVFNKNEINI